MTQEAARAYWRFTILWLIAGAVLGLLSALSFFAPGFLSTQPIIGYGRLVAAHRAAMVHGALFAAVFATGYSLIPKLGQVTSGRRQLSVVLAWAGMIITLAGVLGILFGKGSGREYSDFHPVIAVLFWLYLIVAAIDITQVLSRGKALTSHPSMGLLFISVVLPALVYPFALGDWWGTGLFNALRMWTGWRMLFTGSVAAGAFGLVIWLLGMMKSKVRIHSGGFVLGVGLFVGFGALMGAVHLLDAPIGAPVKAIGAGAGVLAATGLLLMVITLWWGSVKTAPGLLVTAGLTGIAIIAVQGIGLVIPPIHTAFHYTSVTSGHAHLALGSLVLIFLAGALVLTPKLSMSALGNGDVYGRIKVASGWLISGLVIMFLVQTSAGVLQAGAFSEGLSVPDWLPLYSRLQIGVFGAGVVMLVGIIGIGWPVMSMLLKPLPPPSVTVEADEEDEDEPEEEQGEEESEVELPDIIFHTDEDPEDHDREVWNV